VTKQVRGKDKYEDDSISEGLRINRWIQNDSADIHNASPSGSRAGCTADSWQNWILYSWTECIEKHEDYVNKLYNCNS